MIDLTKRRPQLSIRKDAAFFSSTRLVIYRTKHPPEGTLSGGIECSRIGECDSGHHSHKKDNEFCHCYGVVYRQVEASWMGLDMTADPRQLSPQSAPFTRIETTMLLTKMFLMRNIQDNEFSMALGKLVDIFDDRVG